MKKDLTEANVVEHLITQIHETVNSANNGSVIAWLATYAIELRERERKAKLTEGIEHLKNTLLTEFNQDDPDTWPEYDESYDWTGETVLVSDVYITNMGAGQFVNGKWVSVSHDAYDTNRGLAGVTHYLNHKELIG